MGLRRAERQAASKRPAAKLGGGGGWNLKDRDPADLTPAPSYPGTSEGASRPWEVPKRDRPEPRSTNEAVRSADDALISAGLMDDPRTMLPNMNALLVDALAPHVPPSSSSTAAAAKEEEATGETSTTSSAA